MGKLDKLKSQIPQGSQELSTKNHLAKTEIAMSFQNEGTELTRILLRNIEFNPHNLWSCNDDDESIQQLADAIERNGLLHNIVVSQREDGTFMLLSGERRVKALRLLQKRGQESDPTGRRPINGIGCRPRPTPGWMSCPSLSFWTRQILWFGVFPVTQRPFRPVFPGIWTICRRNFR